MSGGFANDVPGDWRIEHRAYPRRVFKRQVMDLILAVELESGSHVHVADVDGVWCLDEAHDCPAFYARGPDPLEAMFDEAGEWPA